VFARGLCVIGGYCQHSDILSLLVLIYSKGREHMVSEPDVALLMTRHLARLIFS